MKQLIKPALLAASLMLVPFRHQAQLMAFAGKTAQSPAAAKDGGATVEQVEDHMMVLLEKDGFYSAAMLQKQNVPFYKSPYDTRQTTSVVGILYDASNAEDTRFDLFNVCMEPALLTDERTLQWTEGMMGSYLKRSLSGALGMTKDGFTILKSVNDLVGIKKISDTEFRFICVPFKKDLTLVAWKESFQQADNGLDESKITCDVFTKDRASAKAVNLAQQKTEMLTMLKSRAKNISGNWEAQDQAEIAAATFPAAAQKDPVLEKKLLAVVQKSGAEIDFDPANLKKLIISDTDWSIRKNEFGEILGKTLGVTIGFSKDGHCYYVSIQVQKDYAGGSTYQESMYFNGFHTRWTELLCDKLK